jgi:fatty acid desaturase
VPAPGYQFSVLAFDEMPKKPADLSWNIFCLVLGLVTFAIFSFALWFDLSYHPAAVIAQTARAVKASQSRNAPQPLNQLLSEK